MLPPTAAIARLPAELFCEIFWLAIPIKDPGFDSLLTAYPPWSLGQVCRQWRLLSISAPRLWSHFIVDLERIMPGAGGGPTALTEQWMERASNVPLTISFSPGGPNRIASNVLRILLRHITRWVQVNLHITEHLYPILDKFSKMHRDLELPVLKSLTYSTCAAHRKPITLFRHAPQLCEVAHPKPSSMCPVELPWLQLTHLSRPVQGDDGNSSTNQTNPTTIHGIIQACPYLISCTVELAVGQNQVAAGASTTLVHRPRITHLALKELRILAPLRVNMSFFQFPQLESLTLDAFYSPLQSLLECVQQSQCKIHTLALRHIPEKDVVVFVQILNLLPSLINLEVVSNHQGVLDHLLQILTISPSDSQLPIPIPRLRHFKLDFTLWGDEFDFSTLVDMLESRWYLPTHTLAHEDTQERCSPIQSITLRATLSASFTQLVRLQDMREQGLMFHSFLECPDEDGD
ncbi:hypothetical protein AX16_002811 [Volvariella volvacea WC 439]|nr:hypothetical protein AX16_002811 [Volvariella volvacea WC 439]